MYNQPSCLPIQKVLKPMQYSIPIIGLVQIVLDQTEFMSLYPYGLTTNDFILVTSGHRLVMLVTNERRHYVHYELCKCRYYNSRVGVLQAFQADGNLETTMAYLMLIYNALPSY